MTIAAVRPATNELIADVPISLAIVAIASVITSMMCVIDAIKMFITVPIPKKFVLTASAIPEIAIAMVAIVAIIGFAIIAFTNKVPSVAAAARPRPTLSLRMSPTMENPAESLSTMFPKTAPN